MQALIHDWIQGLSPAERNLFTLALFIGLCFIIYQIFLIYRRIRFIGDTATSRVSSAAQGYVELKGLGELLGETAIHSPFSQRRCLWYQCKIEVKKSSGKRSHWVEHSNEISDELFVLRDETGDCVVIPDDAQVVTAYKHTWYGHGLNARHNAPKHGNRFGLAMGFGRYRFTERLILIADPVYVIGEFFTAQKTIDPQTVKQRSEELVKFWKTQPQRFLSKFDLNGDGKIAKEEWIRVHQAAKNQITKQLETPDIHTIKKPTERGHPFIISSVPEAQMLQQKRIYLGLYLLLFIAVLYVFLNLLNYLN